ncbi:DUF7133 domain-containing protein [Zavarzinella formosa]|uniref:DUF7133 domain-containing protein n=1 Tax=Zavarzinella formosa TaxID=360055 RepID=UPI0002F9A4A9|nr:c-type cytochrome [Zavarzinella formosa]
MRWRLRILSAGLAALAPAVFLLANPEPPKSGYNPPLAKASDEADKAIARFQYDKSLKVTTWAAEPLLAQPVAFAFDETGKCYVAETFRHSHGATDNRSHMNWLDDELAARTVADRVALYKKDAGKKFAEQYEKEHERVRLVQDTKGYGKADTSTVFSDDFGRAEDGIGAGLLARHGEVFYTCIPDLWKLKDTKGTGYADVKQSMSTGYGVHTAFIGHDLHGLRMGPDGRLYFSLGDRGFNVVNKEGKRLFYPDTGGVLRCDLDGSNLEVFATGLRNPQELAFDDFGNLFTCDNNSDSGDQARFVNVVQGSDSGWRIGYQYGSAMHDGTVRQGNRGPWNYEQLWKPQAENKAFYVLPPLRNFADGPSGFTAYPGVGLAEKYAGHFFLCDFRGGPGGSGVWSFTTKPKGASFEMVNPQHFFWSILATDCEFGPDGNFYVLDWIDGWNLNGKGRIYKAHDEAAHQNPAVAEAKKLLAERFDHRPVAELLKLLGHPHRDVRLESQFALAKKGVGSMSDITAVAAKSDNRLARIHAIWCLGMMGRKDAKAFDGIYPLLADTEIEVRANAAKILGENPATPADKLLPLLADAEPRVRLMAALALARGTLTPADAPKIRDAAFALLKDNGDKDPYLRHAGSVVLAARVPAAAIAEAAAHENVSVRIGAVIALRRQASPEVQAFLADADKNVLTEAARAINDVLITPAMPKLAALLSRTDIVPEVAYRALNANFLVGKAENAVALANHAANPQAAEGTRAVALKMLGDWSTPPRRDYVTGLTQAIEPRPQEQAAAAITAVLGKIFAAPDAVKKEATAVASKLGIKQVGPFLFSLVADAKAPSSSRVDALTGLDALKDAKLTEAVAKALASDDPNLRNAARRLNLKKDPNGVMKQLREVLAGTNIVEQQGAFALLPMIQTPEAFDMIEEWLEKLSANKVAPELALDILEAASASTQKSERLLRRMRSYEAARSKTDDIANFREALSGGDAAKGRDIFLNKAAVQCQRCHKVDGQGGDVGPVLNGLAKQQPRQYLLEAIVLPNKAIAKGFDSVALRMADGRTVSGVLKSDDGKEVKVMTPEGKLITVKSEDVEDKKTTKSAMPEDIPTKLTKREIRDLVEFLASLKEEKK